MKEILRPAFFAAATATALVACSGGEGVANQAHETNAQTAQEDHGCPDLFGVNVDELGPDQRVNAYDGPEPNDLVEIEEAQAYRLGNVVIGYCGNTVNDVPGVEDDMAGQVVFIPHTESVIVYQHTS